MLPAALFASLLVTFPAESQKLPETSRTYVIGAADTNRKERLYLNGVEIDVYRTGAFLAMAKVSAGENVLTFSQGTNVLVRRFFVAPKPSPLNPQPQAAASSQSPTIRTPISASRRMRRSRQSRLQAHRLRTYT